MRPLWTVRISPVSHSRSESRRSIGSGGFGSVKIQLSPDWSEFLSLLIRNEVRFVVVGGHAVAAHGEPRLTEDLDVFVETSPENAARLRRSLVAFGFGDAAPSEEDLAKPGNVWMLGRKPWRIDILTRIDGVTFDEVWRGRVEADFVSKPLYVIGRPELVANKRAAGRAKDLADLAALEPPAPRRARVQKPKPTKSARNKRRG